MLFPILLLSAAGFTVLTTEFVIVGLLPSIARDLNVSVSQAGLLVTLFAFTVAAFGPFLTAYCARFSRKRLFISILIMFAAANTVAALAPNIWVMAVARLIPALGLPVFWALASETAVDIVGPEFAGRAIEKIGFGIVCATVFGIPVGTLISDMFGWRTAFAVLAVIALAKALLLFIYLPVTQAKNEQVTLRSQFKILRGPLMQGHILLSILVFSGMFTRNFDYFLLSVCIAVLVVYSHRGNLMRLMEGEEKPWRKRSEPETETTPAPASADSAAPREEISPSPAPQTSDTAKTVDAGPICPPPEDNPKRGL